MRQYPIQPPTTDSRPAPQFHRHSGEGRNPEGRWGVWQTFSSTSEAKPASQQRRPPTSSRPAPPHSSFRRRPESRGAAGRWGPTTNHGQRPGIPANESRGGGAYATESPLTQPPNSRPPPVDPPNLNPIKISLKIPITSPNNLPETPKAREAGKPLTYNLVRSSLI